MSRGMDITRANDNGSVACGTSLGASGAIKFGPYADCLVKVTSGSTATGTVYGSDDGTTYTVVNTSAGDDLTITFESTNWVRVDSQAFACKFIKIVGNVAGTLAYMVKA